jgi:membrane protein
MLRGGADGPRAAVQYRCGVMRKLWTLLKDTGREFVAEDPFTLAGALVFGEEAARGEVLATFQSAVGSEGAGLVQDVLAQAHNTGSGWFSATVAAIGLLVGATTAFAQLQGALDKIWGVKAPPKPVLALLRGRLLSFVFVVILGVLVGASLVASSVVSALADRISGPAIDWMWRLVDIGVPLVLMTGLFAVLFKLLPDAVVRWREVWVGAAVTSLLFAVGRVGIGIYLGRSGVASAYGAAGSVIVLMVWVYYSSIIVLFGAEITQVVARQSGAEIVGRYPEVKIVKKPAGAKTAALSA